MKKVKEVYIKTTTIREAKGWMKEMAGKKNNERGNEGGMVWYGVG